MRRHEACGVKATRITIVAAALSALLALLLAVAVYWYHAALTQRENAMLHVKNHPVTWTLCCDKRADYAYRVMLLEAELVAPRDSGEEEKVVQCPYAMYYTETEVQMAAKLIYREGGGLKSDTEKACIVWTACNRADLEGFPDTIAAVITAPNAFAYIEDTPVTDELYALAKDVLERWNAEKNGETDVGRVLPGDYAFFHGDGKHNYFRNAYRGDYTIWDYSLPSPYES